MDDARAGLRRRALGDEEEPGAEARPDRRTPGLDWEPRRRSDDDGRGVVAASRLASCPPGVPSIGDLSRSRTSCDAISPRDASAPSEGRRPPGGRGLARRLAPFAFDQREDTAGGQSVAVAAECEIISLRLSVARLPKRLDTSTACSEDALASRALTPARSRPRARVARSTRLDATARHGGRALRGPARQRGDLGGRRDERKRRPRGLLAATKRGLEDRANHVHRRGARRTDDGRSRRDAACRVWTRRRWSTDARASPRRDATRVRPPAGGGGLRPLPVGSTRVRGRDQTKSAVRGALQRERAWRKAR